MYPVLFKLGPFTIHSWGVALAVAFMAGLVVIKLETKRRGLGADVAYDLIIASIIGGVFGARLFYIAGHLDEVGNPLLALFAVWHGGLVFYGGLLGGTLAVLFVIWRYKLPVGGVADTVAPALAIGSAIGRLGCFTNGCCHGAVTKLPWGIVYTDPRSLAVPLGVPLHPTQLIEFAYNVLIFGFLWSVRKRVRGTGKLFLLYLVLYGFFRFWVEFLRVNPAFVLGMSASQAFSTVLVLVGGVGLYISLPNKRWVSGRERSKA